MTCDIKIEKGIPMPASVSRAEDTRNALKNMEIGDSFVWPVSPAIARNRLYQRCRHLGFKILIRAEGDGCRIWRSA